MRAVQFRIALSIAVLGLLTTLALCLIIVQNLAFHEAIRSAAAAHMDAVSAASQGKLKSQIETLSTLVRVLSMTPFWPNLDQRSETGGAVGLFKAALPEVPQADSLYVGYDNGCWLQVRRAEDLNATERQRLQVPTGTVFVVNLVLPTAEGDFRCGVSIMPTATRSAAHLIELRIRRARSGAGIKKPAKPNGPLYRNPICPSALAPR